MLSCLRIGLTAADVEEYSLGMLFDLITTWNNLRVEPEEERVYLANQKDFDAF